VLVYTDGLGAGLNGTWRSATSVAGGDAIAPDTLRFSALDTVNLRLLADLSRLPATHDQSWRTACASLSLSSISLTAANPFRIPQGSRQSPSARLSRSRRPNRVIHGSKGILSSAGYLPTGYAGALDNALHGGLSRIKQRNQLTAEIANFKKLLKTQGTKFALAQKNLAVTQRAIARTRALKSPLTPKQTEGLDDALKTSHEEVAAIYSAIIAMRADLKSFEAAVARLPI
jgi:hypothetical protein